MTDHVHNQLCARIEELESEKMELNEQLDELQKERAALAAHVESARPMVEAYRSQIGGALWALDDEELVFAEAAEEWLVASPETSLARLKAQWQAEALGRVLAEVLTAVEADTVRAHLRNAMRKLRRQAEGGV